MQRHATCSSTKHSPVNNMFYMLYIICHVGDEKKIKSERHVFAGKCLQETENELSDGRTDGWMNRRVDRRKDGWIDWWMIERMTGLPVIIE